mmetsp:Transcript_19210/g.48036  ORF Transcript_19210/g.48036 Transcript_19210/m.48036 type:complete len:367 (-) Transcript_19210:2568-3668(-)
MEAMRPPELVRVFKGHTGSVSAAAFHPAMHQMISGSHDGRLYVWHFKQQLRPFKFEPASSDLGGQNQGHKADVNDVSVAKDGSFFASASSDKTVSLWLNNAKGTPSHVIKAHTGVVRSCHLSPDNSLLATASDDKIVKIWQVTPTSAKFVMSLEGHTHWVRSVRFSQDEPNLVVTCGDDKTVRIWDLRIAGAGAHSAGGGKDRGCVMKMQEHSERVNRAIFHPDGTCIASGSDDRTIKIWDLRRKRLIQHYDAHGAAVLDLDFCHSQNFLASASADRSVKIWDLQEGRLLYTHSQQQVAGAPRSHQRERLGLLLPGVHHLFSFALRNWTNLSVRQRAGAKRALSARTAGILRLCREGRAREAAAVL